VGNGYGVRSNLASSGEPPASHDHFNHCLSICDDAVTNTVVRVGRIYLARTTF